MKLEKFKLEYAKTIDMNPDEIKYDGRNKLEVYYFHVDLKFILKARIYKLARLFDQKVNQSSLQEEQTFKCTLINCVEAE